MITHTSIKSTVTITIIFTAIGIEIEIDTIVLTKYIGCVVEATLRRPQ